MEMLLSVLIVEDDPEMRLVLKKVLAEIDGVEVVGEAADGATALALLEKRLKGIRLKTDINFFRTTFTTHFFVYRPLCCYFFRGLFVYQLGKGDGQHP